GRVLHVVMPLLDFSRTDLAENPHPLFVAAGGVIWGSILPLLFWGGSHAVRWRYSFLLRFFAGFCLIANGGYMAAAFVLPVGDAADLLRLGVSKWLLVVCGTAGVAAGLALWNGLGPKFGIVA